METNKTLKLIIVLLLIINLINSAYLNKNRKVIYDLEMTILRQQYEIEIINSICQNMQQETIEKEADISYGVFKSYMDYKAITNKTSIQYKLQKLARTDQQGLRKIDDCYMIATGSFYGNVGDIFEIKLSSGKQFKAIKGDSKNDKHTDEQNKVCLQNGSVIEFIVDTDNLQSEAKKTGDISSIGFVGSVNAIERIGSYELE